MNVQPFCVQKDTEWDRSLANTQTGWGTTAHTELYKFF